LKFGLGLLFNSRPLFIVLGCFAFGDGSVWLDIGGVFESVEELARVVVGGVQGERVVIGIHGGEIGLERSVVLAAALHCASPREQMAGERTGLAGIGTSLAARKHSLF
jgi:hypothetical protein